MYSKNNYKGSVFDAEQWQLHYDRLQEPIIIALSDLGRSYRQLKMAYNKAPPHLKKGIYKRLKRLEKLIETIEEGHRQGRLLIGSMAASMYVESERVRQLQAVDIQLMQQTIETVSNIALNLCEKRINKTENNTNEKH